MTQFFGTNAFKFGLFGINCSGGMAMSVAEDRWKADWQEITEVAKMSDEAGIEFILPIARWRGLGGDSDMWGRSFETFTQAAALGSMTKKTGIFVTAHVPVFTPVFVAKAISTLDHITNGRVGLNIVCGWNADEFRMHGVAIDGEHRYDQGLEWASVVERILKGEPEFDFKGQYYDLQGLTTDPLPVQKPRPPIMSAGSSAGGQAFAAKIADILFTTFSSLDQIKASMLSLKAQAAAHGRTPDIYGQTFFICRPTRKEAEDYYYHFAEEKADLGALNYMKRQKTATISKRTLAGETEADRTIMQRMTEPDRLGVGRMEHSTGKRYSGMFPGIYPIVGTPDDVVAELVRIQQIGIAGATAVFMNYLKELPYFVQEVLPRLERLGLRRKVRETAA
jgi:alkanesulfonate monooxygenase SsuD/methylene tetrahydromethanopterin reductase-like flavin-dependent oxidoreductase (luciferase family)